MFLLEVVSNSSAASLLLLLLPTKTKMFHKTIFMRYTNSFIEPQVKPSFSDVTSKSSNDSGCGLEVLG